MDNYHIQLSLARLAIGMCGRNKADEGVEGVLWQVMRLVKYHRARDEQVQANKLQALVDWFNTGAVVSSERVVLSAEPLAQRPHIP